MNSKNEKVARPEVLVGTTYKIKSPLTENALYITINDIVINKGTQEETRRPFEMFINSKAMDHFQWITALTMVISAVFRNGGDVTYLVGELHSVFDPKGGYLKKGGKYVPSLVAEIGDILETHLRSIGMIPPKELDSEQKKYLEMKKEEIKKLEAAASKKYLNNS